MVLSHPASAARSGRRRGLARVAMARSWAWSRSAMHRATLHARGTSRYRLLVVLCCFARWFELSLEKCCATVVRTPYSYISTTLPQVTLADIAYCWRVATAAAPNTVTDKNQNQITKKSGPRARGNDPGFSDFRISDLAHARRTVAQSRVRSLLWYQSPVSGRPYTLIKLCTGYAPKCQGYA